MSKKKERINTERTMETMGSNPFMGLDAAGLPNVEPKSPKVQSNQPQPSSKKRSLIEMRREKSGRGGKTVTTLRGFEGVGRDERETLLKDLKKQTGTGGSFLEDGGLLLQGDCRDQIEEILQSAGYKTVRAGG